MKTFHFVLVLIVVGIGLYMTIMYAGKALPPTLSGVAFLAIGMWMGMRELAEGRR